jgi:hypothetical protein
MDFNFGMKCLIEKLKVSCLNEECDWEGSFEEIQLHLLKDCKYLFLCKCEKILFKENQELHLEECGEEDINCSCNKKIKRKVYDEHVKNECPETENIPCINEKYGCWWKSKRKELHICPIGDLVKQIKQWKKISKLHGYRENELKRTKSIQTLIRYYPLNMEPFIKSGLVDRGYFMQESPRSTIFRSLMFSKFIPDFETLNSILHTTSSKKRKKEIENPIEWKQILTIEGWNITMDKNVSVQLNKEEYKKPLLIITSDQYRLFILNELASGIRFNKKGNEISIKWESNPLSQIYETPFVLAKKNLSDYIIQPVIFTIKEATFKVLDEIWAHRFESLFIKFISK